MVDYCYIDLETYNETLDLTKVGTWKYAEGVEIMLCAIASNNEPVHVIDLTVSDALVDSLRAELRYRVQKGHVFVAHNVQFERSCIKSFLDVDIPIEQWEDTAVLALMHGYPEKLTRLCEALHIPESNSKIKEGRRLIQKFCSPREPSANNPDTRWTAQNAPEDWDLFIEYCRRDVDVMRFIHGRLPRFNWTDRERELWYLDQRINERGLPIDRVSMLNMIAAIDAEIPRLNGRLAEITDGAVDAASKRDAMLNWLADQFVFLPGLTKTDVLAALERADLPALVREALEIRQQVSKTSNGKYAKLLMCICEDDRMRGTLAFYGAMRTGRWAGRLLQGQNLPSRGVIKDAENAIDLINEHGPGILALFYTEPLVDIASGCIRGMIKAPAGQKIVQSDLSGIEARTLPWLAMDEEGLDVFREGRDVYVATAARMFGLPESEITKDLRQVGKVSELSQGYQGALGAFRKMMDTYGIPQDMFTDEQILDFVKAFRAAKPLIRSFWYDLEATALAALKAPGESFACRRIAVTYRPNILNGYLLLRLSSGRYLCYPEPEIKIEKAWREDFKVRDTIMAFETEDELRGYLVKQHQVILGKAKDLDTLKAKARRMLAQPYDKEVIYFSGFVGDTRAWGRVGTYGGKLVENCTQAAARDVMAHNMPAVEDAGYEIILTVHDELVALAPDTDEYTARAMSALLATNPPWADGLPLDAGGFEALRYRKD